VATDADGGLGRRQQPSDVSGRGGAGRARQGSSSSNSSTAAKEDEGREGVCKFGRAGGVFNNEQGRAAVLSDARHGGGQRVQKKRMRERLGSRSQQVGIHIDQRLAGRRQANESTRVSAPRPGPGWVAGWRQQLWRGA
jgi:hypothetical protein